MHVADDVFGIALIDGQARVLILAHAPQNLIEARIHRYGNDFVARHHDFARGIVRKFEQRLNGVFLEAMQMALGAAGADDEFQFLGGMAASGVAAAEAHKAGERGGRALGKEYERRGKPSKTNSAGATRIASRSAFSMARFLGTTSPMTTCA